MYITKKAGKILRHLMQLQNPISIGVLAVQLDMSSRSVRSYMKEVEEIVQLSEGRLINKPGVGVQLELTEFARQKIFSLLHSESAYMLDAKHRRNYMIHVFQRNTSTYTIQLFSDELSVSKNEVVKDLLLVEEWLRRFDIELIRQPGSGLCIRGSEMNIRQSMAFFNRHYPVPWLREREIEKKPLSKGCIDLVLLKKLYAHHPQISVWYVTDCILRTEASLPFTWTIEARSVLLSQALVMIERTKIGGSFIHTVEDQGIIPDNILEAAQTLWKRMNEAYEVSLPRSEIHYLAICMMGLDCQCHGNSDLYTQLDVIWKTLSDEILCLIGGILGYRLNQDSQLRELMSIALRSMFYRIKYRIWVMNPLLEDIKKRYSSLFGACWSVSTLFEQKFGLHLNENEVGNIALLVGGAISRYKSKPIVRTMIVCASGIGVSQYIASMIEEEIPDIRVVRVLPYSEAAKGVDPNAIDLILCTENMLEFDNCISVVVPLTEENIKTVRNAAKEILWRHPSDNLLHKANQLYPQIVLMDLSLRRKQDILREGCMAMESRGWVTSLFIEKVLKREQVSSTCIGNGIAIPHGLEADTEILQPSIGIIRLENTIQWGDDVSTSVDLVFLLGLRFLESNDIGVFFRRFYYLLKDKELIARVKAAKTSKEIEEFMVKEGVFHGDSH